MYLDLDESAPPLPVYLWSSSSLGHPPPLLPNWPSAGEWPLTCQPGVGSSNLERRSWTCCLACLSLSSLSTRLPLPPLASFLHSPLWPVEKLLSFLVFLSLPLRGLIDWYSIGLRDWYAGLRERVFGLRERKSGFLVWAPLSLFICGTSSEPRSLNLLLLPVLEPSSFCSTFLSTEKGFRLLVWKRKYRMIMHICSSFFVL